MNSSNRIRKAYLSTAIERLEVGIMRTTIEQHKSLAEKVSIDIINHDQLVPLPAFDSQKQIIDQIKLMREADLIIVDMSIENRNYIGCVIELVEAKKLCIPSYVYVDNTSNFERGSLRYLTNNIFRDINKLYDCLNR